MKEYIKFKETPTSYLLADALVVLGILALTIGLIHFADAGSAPFIEAVPIDSSLSALPGYALLSLVRSLIALALSYTFAVIYGTIAASDARLERVMIPMLDVLQSLPVLSFLPGFVLTLTLLFNNSRWGLELACVLLIFTGQVWNLVFAYYESQKMMPPEFRDVAKLAKLSAPQKFFLLDLPNGLRPLIYNGMMSMAGGWFFLTLCEAFVLGQKNYRLPGLGSYLSVAFETQNYKSFFTGLAFLMVIISGVDFVLWKPLIAWFSRFRDTSEASSESQSLFLEIVKQTRLPALTSRLMESASTLFRRDTGATVLPEVRLVQKVSAAGQELFTTNRLSVGGGEGVNAERRGVLRYARFSHNLRSRPRGPLMVAVLVAALVLAVAPKLPALVESLAALKLRDWLDLVRALLFTAAKVAGVLIVATLWTVPFGLWVGQNARIARIAQPFIQNIAAFPAPVLYPLLAMLFQGAGVPAGFIATFLMTVGNQWYLLFNVISGAMRIPGELKLVTQVYRFTSLNTWTKLYIPVLLPSLATGWISAAGGSWNASIVAEIVEFPGGVIRAEGIGAEITEATMNGDYPRLIASIIVLTFALIIINRTVWRSLHRVTEKVQF